MIRGISFLAKSTIDNDLYRILKNESISSNFCNVTFFEGQEDVTFHGVIEGKNF